jgi:tetratricopeptide (TPR) repeat protein
VARIRAKLHQRSLDWPEAAKWLTRTVERAPQNVAAIRDQATLLNTLGRSERALAAANRGLALVPRDDDLLRVRALTLEALGHTTSVIDAAKHAYQTHRRIERPTEVRARCAANDAMCALERLHVHTHPIPQRSVEP